MCGYETLQSKLHRYILHLLYSKESGSHKTQKNTTRKEPYHLRSLSFCHNHFDLF